VAFVRTKRPAPAVLALPGFPVPWMAAAAAPGATWAVTAGRPRGPTRGSGRLRTVGGRGRERRLAVAHRRPPSPGRDPGAAGYFLFARR